MKTTQPRLAAGFTALALFAFSGQAQAKSMDEANPTAAVVAKSAEADAPKIMIEIDPMPFGLKGHAVHVRVPIASVPGLVVSAGTYGMSFPDLLTDINSENRDEGWNAQIDKAYATFADYHFSGKVEGLFVGAQLASQGFEVERDQSDERIDFGVVIAMARVGTLWKPFDSGFYVLPWAGVFANIRTDDNNLEIGGEKFDVAPVAGFATLHLGWQY